MCVSCASVVSEEMPLAEFLTCVLRVGCAVANVGRVTWSVLVKVD